MGRHTWFQHPCPLRTVSSPGCAGPASSPGLRITGLKKTYLFYSFPGPNTIIDKLSLPTGELLEQADQTLVWEGGKEADAGVLGEEEGDVAALRPEATHVTCTENLKEGKEKAKVASTVYSVCCICCTISSNVPPDLEVFHNSLIFVILPRWLLWSLRHSRHSINIY